MTDIEMSILAYLERYKYHALKLKTILFDMDGVLFDSMKNHTLAWYQVISELGIPCSREEFYQYEGATGKWTVNHLFQRAYGREATEEEIKEIYTAKSDCFNELPPAEVMPGAKRLLYTVKELGLTPILVTGSGQRSLLQRLDQEFPQIFSKDHLVTAFDVCHGKPNPEPYLKGLEKAGALPWQALVVENAPLGVKAGVAAGIFTIAVNSGPIPDQQLFQAGADLVYPDMPDFALNGFPDLWIALS